MTAYSIERHQARKCQAAPNVDRVEFRALTGRYWAYGGKRGRVLRLLALGHTLTQHDTWPWLTRLGGTIHAMREDGLDVETVLEGEFRHARYRLLTPGLLTVRGK